MRIPRFQVLQHSQLGDHAWHSLLIALLRGLAALQVAAAHTRNEFLPSLRTLEQPAVWYQLLAFITGFAHQAVVLFFLISGWLVGGSLLNKLDQPQALAHYAVDRLSRLWTVLLPTFALCMACAMLTGEPAGAALAWPVLLGNLIGLQTVSLPVFGGNYPLWSLANESWYYVLFPLLMLYGAGRQRLLVAILMLAVICLLPFDMLLYFVIWLLGAAFSRVRLRCGTPTRCLLVGLLLALSVYFRLRGSNDDLVAASFGQDLLLSLIFLPLLASLVTPIAAHGPWMGRLQRGAHWLSDRSFTLYVVHVPVLGLLHWICLHCFGHARLDGDDLSDLLAYGLMLTVILGFSSCFYWLFESRTPIVRRTLKRWLLRPAPPLVRLP
ncbi:MAG: acyltransferase family protein [Massilia sp.]